MLTIFSYFKQGFITILSSPFWLIYFAFSFLKASIVFIISLIEFIIAFFKGESLFKTKQDRIIDYLRAQDQEAIDSRIREAAEHVK